MKTIILFFALTITSFSQSGWGFWGWFNDEVAESVYGIDLNGTNEYAQIASPDDMVLTGEFTIMFWTKPTDLEGDQDIIARDINTSRGWELFFNTAEFKVAYNSGIGGNINSGISFTAGAWDFITVTQTLSGVDTTKIYKNGVLGYSIDGVILVETAAPLSIGRRAYPGFEAYYNGVIGQVQFVNGYALTQTEITNAYNNGFSDSYTSGTVVAWYKWSGATDAEMLQDHSASGNDLTGTNVTTADQVRVGTSYR